MKTIWIIFLIILAVVLNIDDSYSQLNGTYTIGVGGNYSTITNAVNDLETLGVNGPVILNILPGNYQEDITIDSIPNISSQNNVTFKSSANDPTTVTWGYWNEVSPILSIRYTEFITVKLLTFATTVYGIYINGYGIHLRGINISNNIFNNLERPIEIWFADSPVIEKNNIRSRDHDNVGVSRAIGISLNWCTKEFKVFKNTFSSSGSSFGAYATCLLMYGCSGNNNAEIANNYFYSTSRNFSCAINIEESSLINIYNNSSLVLGSNSTNYMINSGSSIVSKNNLSVIYGGLADVGYAYILNNSDITADVNTFNTRTYFAKINNTNILTLSEFVNMTGDDINSNTAYITTSEDGYHLTGSSVGDPELLGISISGITDDIDGDPRDPFEPYKGADEVQYPASIEVYLNAFIEGFYDPAASLQAADSIKAFLHKATVPYNKVDSIKGVLKSNGKLILRFVNAQSGTYYISVKHRNSIETWSRSGGENLIIGGYSIYDFTTSDSQAYGNNLKLRGNKYCIYCGDVDQSGFIDVSDIVAVYNDVLFFNSGYLTTDLSGDDFVDSSDLLICYNNLYVGVITP